MLLVVDLLVEFSYLLGTHLYSFKVQRNALLFHFHTGCRQQCETALTMPQWGRSVSRKQQLL